MEVLKTTHYGILIIWLLFLGPASWVMPVFDGSDTEHYVRVIHPGVSLTDSVGLLLVARRTGPKAPFSFYSDVESVVCGDKVCRIDLVRIWWDELGNYLQLEPPIALDLEKKDGQAFTALDYRRLDSLLGDRHSPLKDVYEWEIVGPTGGEGVDALSSATIALDTDAYVAGAVWTCYTLWHWVNGGAVDHIRRLSGAAMPTDKLRDSLRCGSDSYQIFALEELARREDFSKAGAMEAQKSVLNNPRLADAALAYFSAAPDDVFKEAVLSFLTSSDEHLRLDALRAVVRRGVPNSSEFLLGLTSLVTERARYRETHILLQILAKASAKPSAINERLITLLQQDDFLTARIAYWYLREQELYSSLQVQVDAFYHKHRKLLN